MEGLLKLFFSGSSNEGEAYANHFRRDKKLQDIDLMMELGCLYSETQLVPIDSAPGFVLVKWSPENQIGKLPHKDGFVDGFRIKQLHADRMKPSCDAISFLTSEFNTKPDLASIEASMRLDFGDQSSLFNDSLKYVEMLQKGENKMRDFKQYYEWIINNTTAVSGLILPQAHMSNIISKGYLQDYYSMLSPAFGFRMPVDQVRKAESILNFYFKYRSQYSTFVDSLRNREDMGHGDTSSLDIDVVPSLKLDFWPPDMQWFLNRLKMNRPLLFEQIEPLHMHVIPKWSGKTTTTDKNLEFRYSFSAIEMKIAEERSFVEQILNRVARGLFYKYLHKGAMASSLHYEKYLTSYFVKTTVLWMCEKEDLDGMYTVTTTDTREAEKSLATRMANRWIAHACSAFKSGYYPHYFIKSYNILEGFSEQYLDRLCHILQNDVNLQDDCVIIPDDDITKNIVQIEKRAENVYAFWKNLDDESQFFSDCIELNNEFMNGLKLGFNFFAVNNGESSDDDNDHNNSDSDEDDNNDSDTEFDVTVTAHCYQLLEMMTTHDSSEMNNWELWKKLFIIDVSKEAPELHQHVKTTRNTLLHTIVTMTSVLSVKKVDRYISDRELKVILQNPLSVPMLPNDDIMSLSLNRVLPIISQQRSSEPYRRTILEKPENTLEPLVQFANRFLANSIRDFFYSEQIEIVDQASPSSTKLHPTDIENEGLIMQTAAEQRPLGKNKFEICMSQPILPFSIIQRCL